MNPIHEKLWCIEHQIRSLTQKGMRVGKAIKRLIPDVDAAVLTRITKVWDGSSFGMIEATSPEEWEKAYQDVRSCMQGHGRFAHDSYSRVGVRLVYIEIDENVVARGLHNPRNNMYSKTYGEKSYVLEGLFQLLGIELDYEWLDDSERNKIGVARWNRQEACRYYQVLEERECVFDNIETAQAFIKKDLFWSPTNPKGVDTKSDFKISSLPDGAIKIVYNHSGWKLCKTYFHKRYIDKPFVD